MADAPDFPVVSQIRIALDRLRLPKGPKGEKRHADTVQNAMLVARIATGEVDDAPSTSSQWF